MVVPCRECNRQVVFADAGRKVDPNLKEKLPFACFFAEEGRRELDICNGRYDKTVVGVLVDCIGGLDAEHWVALKHVKYYAGVHDHAHGRSPSRSSFIHSAVVRGFRKVDAYPSIAFAPLR